MTEAIERQLETLLAFANSHVTKGDYEKAREYAQEGLAIIRQNEDLSAQAAGWYKACFFLVLAHYYAHQNNWTEVNTHYIEGIKVLNRSHPGSEPFLMFTYVMARFYYGWGLCYALVRLPEDSVAKLNIALELFTRLKNMGNEAGVNGRIQTLLLLCEQHLAVSSKEPPELLPEWLAEVYQRSMSHKFSRQAIMAMHLFCEYYGPKHAFYKFWRRRLLWFGLSRPQHVQLVYQLMSNQPPKHLLMLRDFHTL